jgi:hypothetical protein
MALSPNRSTKKCILKWDENFPRISLLFREFEMYKIAINCNRKKVLADPEIAFSIY